MDELKQYDDEIFFNCKKDINIEVRIRIVKYARAKRMFKYEDLVDELHDIPIANIRYNLKFIKNLYKYCPGIYIYNKDFHKNNSREECKRHRYFRDHILIDKIIPYIKNNPKKLIELNCLFIKYNISTNNYSFIKFRKLLEMLDEDWRYYTSYNGKKYISYGEVTFVPVHVKRVPLGNKIGDLIL